jgi:hypothetical protein
LKVKPKNYSEKEIDITTVWKYWNCCRFQLFFTIVAILAIGSAFGG